MALKLSDNALRVLEKRYLKKDENGKVVETPQEMFSRVAKSIASADRLFKKSEEEVASLEKDFYHMMTALEFMPNSPTLMNAGRDLSQLSACFVLPIEDSMDSIFDSIKATALIHKSGGGTGFSFSRLRPRSSTVRSTGGIASGPISFMKVFDAATQAVKQGGTRRGANMGILRVDHPDIMDFIVCKESDKEINNFNISVAVTEDFMRKVVKDEEYDLINPMIGKAVKKLNAKTVFDLMVKMAHKNGEPGIIFIDRINNDNPTPQLGKIESTNPCVTGDTLVSTEKGLMKIKDIAQAYPNGGLNIFTDDRVLDILYGSKESTFIATKTKVGVSLETISAAFKTGVKPVLKLITESGLELIATPDHKIMTPSGWVEMKDLRPGVHKILIQPDQDHFSEDNVLADIKSIEPDGEREVYDLTEPSTHSFIANGIVISNCGEQPLLPYESCNLGSINIYALLKDMGDRYEIDWDRLKEVVRLSVHFLDNVIEINKFPLPEIEKMTRQTRKIGLGIMGWASALAKMMIPYDSDEAIELGDKLMSFIQTEAKKSSSALVKARGVFPAFKGSVYDKDGGIKLRNATLTTIAPTGTISIIAGPCSSGIEPMFAISYHRANILDNDKMIEIEPAFKEAMEARGLYSRKLMEKIAEKGSIQEIDEVPADIKRVFVTAHDISPEWHIRMQAIFQKYTDNAVSKTVNFHQEATVDDVREAYLMAYELGCKGVTIYRDKSRDEQVLNVGTKDPSKQANVPLMQALGKIAPRPRPEVVTGTTTKVSTGCGNLYVTINTDEINRPFEVFTSMGKAGGCAMSQLEAIGRLVSLAFRSGVDVKVIVEQLRSIRCPSPSWEKGSRIFSCADAIARVIERRLVQAKVESPVTAAEMAVAKEDLLNQVSRSEEQLEDHLTGNIVGVCPDCGGVVRHEEGCVKCSACGYTKC